MNFTISKTPDSKESFAVSLITVPDFPDSRQINEVVRTPHYAVIGAVYDENGWSYTTLLKEEKHIIGDMLVANGAKPNEWWWCTQYV